jgi:hypothetical protein
MIKGAWEGGYTACTDATHQMWLDATHYHPQDDLNFLRGWKNGSYPEGWDKKPVTWVSLEDARAYAKWADKRLPHEWEWQYAALRILEEAGWVRKNARPEVVSGRTFETFKRGSEVLRVPLLAKRKAFFRWKRNPLPTRKLFISGFLTDYGENALIKISKGFGWKQVFAKVAQSSTFLANTRRYDTLEPLITPVPIRTEPSMCP